MLNLPASLKGKSALDIGAWDGYFAFELERRGASNVTALDHYAWSIDHPAYQRYHVEMRASGQVPLPPDEVPNVWQPHTLPGMAGFTYARGRLKSSVRPVVADFMTMDLVRLGQFDVVLFLGVLYHLKDPFLALRRLREVTKELAVIETAGVVLPGWSNDKLWMFLEDTELNDDLAIGGPRPQPDLSPPVALLGSATHGLCFSQRNTLHPTLDTVCTTGESWSTPSSSAENWRETA